MSFVLDKRSVSFGLIPFYAKSSMSWKIRVLRGYLATGRGSDPVHGPEGKCLQG